LKTSQVLFINLLHSSIYRKDSPILNSILLDALLVTAWQLRRMTFNSGSILRMWVECWTARMVGERRARRARCRDRIIKGEIMEKGKSILWYWLRPRTALVAIVNDDDEERKSVCAVKNCRCAIPLLQNLLFGLYLRFSPFVAYRLSLIMVSYTLHSRKIETFPSPYCFLKHLNN